MTPTDHPREPRELDSVKRGLARLELATPAAEQTAEAAALEDAPALGGRAEPQRSFEQSVAITDVDPLSIDLPRAIAYLGTQLAHSGIAVPASAMQLYAKVTQTEVTQATADALLTDIAALLLAEGTALDAVAMQLSGEAGGAAVDWADGAFTLLVGAVFRPILIELASRWTQAASHMPAATAHAAVAYAASLLVGAAPQVGGLAMAFFEQHAPAQCLAQMAADAAAQGRHESAAGLAAVGVRLTRRLPACLKHPAAWDWASAWTQLMAPANTPAARLLAAEGLAEARGLTDAGRAQLAHTLGAPDALVVHVRTWLRLGAQRMDAYAQRLMVRLNHDALAGGLWAALDAGAPHAWLAEQRLSSSVASVGGVLLHAQPGAARSNGGFVVTPTVARSAHALALATSRREPVLLVGAPGSGKTALVEWAARRTGHELVTIHLSSSVDAKTLVGSYVTTQRAGHFEWRAGLLTQAVRLGHWVLVEDIDGAAADVAQTLAPLLESQRLFVPSRGEEVPAHVRFRMFATVGTHANTRTGLLASGAWTRVHVAAPDAAEAAMVVGGVHPALAGGPADRLAQAFARVGRALGDAGGALTTRDLLAWCARLQLFGGAADAFRAFVEAADAFAMREPDYARWRQQLRALGQALGVAAVRVDQHVDQHVPEITRAAQHLRVGRARLDCAAGGAAAGRAPFAETRHARSLLERIACCVQLGAPVLLTGETGTGKTTVVQQLAQLAGRPLAVFNLSQQSDASDLLGGFRPVDTAAVALKLREAFDRLFARTASARKNAAFLDSVRQAHARRDWRRLARLFHAAVQMADEMLARAASIDGSGSSKKARLAADQVGPLSQAWRDFSRRVAEFDAVRGARVAFAFAEGALVQAARAGGWILLDEANLATAETLACLGGLLQPAAARSLVLAETGERIPCHADFRLFACMNPATDVGKRDLPAGLRRAFAEFYVHPPDAAADDLLAIVRAHLPTGTHDTVARGVIAFYAHAKRLAAEHRLVDGAAARPHYSLRTLARALTYARDHAPAYSLRRALVDGLCMTFATQLDPPSHALVLQALAEHVAPGGAPVKQLLAHVPPPPPQGDCVLVEGFWLRRGPEPSAAEEAPFIATPSVAAKLRGLARAVMCARYPVLIQGPTSAGKTSMVAHLAHATGHRFVRINNHEHTDLQEYLGAYASVDGRLEFREGLLVRALRHGHWLVLDELNLAPSDVLEALNRLLDDNRELHIPETGETVRPHPHFMLFATQNPAGGAYGGRKALSRAFRNRFVELHFGDIPADELQRIITDACAVPPSHAELLVRVYGELTAARARTRIFEAAQGLVTLRDLFRWARRHASTRLELAQHGYMLLAERARTADDRLVVQRALERVLLGDTPARPRRIDTAALYSVEALHAMDEFRRLQAAEAAAGAVVWTRAMRRLFVLAALCARHEEPVLLVGATGCGKTTVCQMLAAARDRPLHVLNCHQGTEASDVIGGQRPVRNRAALVAQAREALRQLDAAPDVSSVDSPQALDALRLPADNALVQQARGLLERAQGLFAWHDGPLVQAMRRGHVFLMDELNLADDSVLERLNSALEPSRTLVLAEQAGGSDAAATVRAQPAFAFMATMNPGGDYGKRELSPALRNRFAEIWAPSAADPQADAEDLRSLLELRLHGVPEARECAAAILGFVTWLQTDARLLPDDALSLRDFLCWADFVRQARSVMPAAPAVVHGGCLVLLDALGAQGAAASMAVRMGDAAAAAVKARCVDRLCRLVGWDPRALQPADRRLLLLGVAPAATLGLAGAELAAAFTRTADAAGVAPFLVPAGPQPTPASLPFALDAPTTFDNLVRVLRAMQVGKPLLLEGSPGVGKTALVSSLARLAGHRLVRVNLSDQTDLMDLFGSDLPTASGGFAWCDAPFLQALRQGDWVLLDEINLASQSVLEGLNACLDHRAAVYIAELDREFKLAPGFRLFAAQNPMAQGGGRKGLPRSFVNRFTQVYMHELLAEDLTAICAQVHRHAPEATRKHVLELNAQMHRAAATRQAFTAGAPWEFNLRDVGRLLDALRRRAAGRPGLAADRLVDVLYVQRMRTPADRQHVRRLFSQAFGRPLDAPLPALQMTPEAVQVGGSVLRRSAGAADASPHVPRLRALHAQMAALEALATCVEMQWPAILVGPSGSGKTALVRWLAAATGHRLVEFAMNAGVDTSEILGGFEQVDVQRHCTRLAQLALRLAAAAPLTAESERISRAAHAAMRNVADRAALCLHVEALAALLDAPDQQPAAAQALRRGVQSLAGLDAAGRFEWVDGVLVDALVHGHWLLLDHANLCSAAVLDRLNGLLEPQGVLHVSEDPTRTDPVVPHESFRIFLAVDPANGELSRAMRNRGVEICLLPAEQHPAMLRDDQAAVARAVGVPQEMLAADVRPEQSMTALVQQAMLVAERVQRGGVVQPPVGESAAVVRAPDTVGDAAVARAAWQAGLLNYGAPAGDHLQAQRMLLAALSTLAPCALETQHLCFVLQARAPASSAAQHALRLLADGAEMTQALAHVRSLLAGSLPLAHPDALLAAPARLAFNPAVHQALVHMSDAQPLLTAWHSALCGALLLQRERLLADYSEETELDLREHVLQRANIDIAHVQRVFGLLDACAGLVDAWEVLVRRLPGSPETALVLPGLVDGVRHVVRAKARIERLVRGSGAQSSSAMAVAFEMLQRALMPMLAADVPEEVRGRAEALAAEADGLVRDASMWARLWAAAHPVTLADPQARVLEQRLHGYLAAGHASAAMAVEALAMLLATASRKDHRLVVAA
ncbi:AAA ATPase midasin, partial [Coemansia interrupta]